MPNARLTATQFGPQNLVDLVRYRVQHQKNEMAFVYLANGVDDEIPMTYCELDRRSRAIGAWLQQNQMRGKRILLLYPPGLDFITAFFGCLYAGAIAVPVYPPRRNRSMFRIQAVADSANASLALTSDDVLDRVRLLIDETPDLKKIPWFATSNMEPGLEDAWTNPELTGKDLAFLQYTSGSTGTPKGVMLSHGNMIHNSMLISIGFEHTRSSKGVFWLPCYHDMGLIGGIIQPVYCGRPNILMSPLSFLQKPFRWISAISKYRATTSGGPNFAYDLCVRQIRDDQLEGLDLSCWKVAFNGAEPVQADTLENFTRKFEPYGFRYESFYPCFGLAEGTLIVTGASVADKPVIQTVDADALAAGKFVDAIPGTDRIRRLVSSGQMIFDERIAIVDPETKLECQDGTVGEIWVQSGSVAQGYWDAPEATEQTFKACIQNTGEGPFMRTGDLGFIHKKELFVTGRIKDLIIIRGVNVYPQDIEMTAQKVDTVLRVNGGGAFMLGEENNPKLILIQEVERRFKPEMGESIFKEIRKAIALEHEISVDSIVFVRAGSIPKTSSGKIQRHACRSDYLAGTLNVVASWSMDEEIASGIPDVSAVIKERGTKTLGSYTEEDNPLHYDPNFPKGGSVEEPEHIPSDEERMKSVFLVEKAGQKMPATLPGTLSGTKNVGTASSIPLTNLTFEEIAKIVLEEVHKVAKERARGLTLDTDITELGLDSLERMEILASLEDRFGGQFPETVLPTLNTAREVIAAVSKYLGGGQKAAAERPKQELDKIPASVYDIAQFPECVAMHKNVVMLNETKLNHFFDVHEGITNDTTIIGGKTYINFSSYNYISTSGDPEVTKAAQEAAAKYGTSASASRMVSGEKVIHRELENEITRFLGTEDTIVMVGGHATNETVIGHLFNSEDMILHDALSHNSLVQGAILSGARRRPFPHNDWEAAQWILEKHRGEYRRVLIVLEGVYSMDGDFPDLPKFVEMRKKYKSLIMVDEAHSLGVLGKTGHGIAEHFNVNRSDVDLWMCTLSKTFASCGGYISGRKELVEYLKYSVPGFMFSVGMPPMAAGAALAALKILEREPQRVEQLRKNSAYLLKLAKEAGLNTGTSQGSAVVPVIIGNSILCLKLSKALFDNGINVQPILHPAVEEKAARMRFFVTSSHKEEQIRYTIETLVRELNRLRQEEELTK